MRPCHLFKTYILKILILSLVWNSQPLPRGVSAMSQEPPINHFLSQAAKLTGATNRDIICDWLRTLIVIGREGEAFEWARQIADPELQSEALRVMTATLFRSGKRDEALRAAEAAYASAQRINPRKENLYYSIVDQRAFELCKLAEMLGQGGEVEKARQIAAEAFN